MKIELPEFKTQKEKIAYLVKNKAELIDVKKSAIKNFVDSPCMYFGGHYGTAFKQGLDSRDTEDVLYRTIIGNTYNWMDSHDDVHVGSTFGVSINQRKGKIYHRHDHINQLTAKVGKFSNVYEKQLSWAELGVGKAGYTTSLLADTEIKRSYNGLIFDAYKEGEIDQHSVGMIYVKIDLAVNDAAYEKEFKEWNAYYPILGNHEKAEQKGYFWAVKEAKLIEISCVTEGSNVLTGIYNPAKASDKIDPVLTSQEIKNIFVKAFKN